MSKRLDYLAKARPEAATAYLTFLKESGRYLDEKTRFLISVVTKVISGTPSGIKQYVPHAMRAGASGQEIIDAVLMSFPAAGLTKVLDALDVLAEMNVPDFKLENLGKEPVWTDVIKESELAQKNPFTTEIFLNKVLVYKGKDGIKAYDGRCPHLGNKLPAKCEGSKLTCAVHKWDFDLDSGECMSGGDRDLRAMPCRIENGMVQVKIVHFE